MELSIIIFYFLGINLLSYTVYMLDKKQAINQNYRISEEFLLTLVVVGGTFGSFLSMLINRHKIKKVTFLLKFILANGIFVFIFIYMIDKYQRLIADINSMLL